MDVAFVALGTDLTVNNISAQSANCREALRHKITFDRRRSWCRGRGWGWGGLVTAIICVVVSLVAAIISVCVGLVAASISVGLIIWIRSRAWHPDCDVIVRPHEVVNLGIRARTINRAITIID